MMNIDSMLNLVDSWNNTTVTCPKCGYHQDLTDIDYAEEFVTFWGDRGPVEFQCPHCDYEMKVEERVMRSFEIVEED